MIEKISKLDRYIACGRVTKRPIFEFVDSKIRPNDSLQVFAIDDDYSFGILQSNLHWIWFQERGSTLKRDPRYTSETVFNYFPFPQELPKHAVLEVANAAQHLRLTRREMMFKHNISLRDLYRITEGPGTSKVVEAQQELDLAVEKAYGVRKRSDQLQHLLDLNAEIAEKELSGDNVVGPGTPNCLEKRLLITEDRIGINLTNQILWSSA